MTTTDARKRIQDHINAMHEKVAIAMTGAWPYPPTEPRDQEHTMTSPTERRHEELRDLLTEIRDRLPEPEGVDSVEWDCPSCGEADLTWTHECADVTEEPPVGSQVTDRDGDVWQRYEAGWTCWCRHDLCWGRGVCIDFRWDGVRDFHPLRLTTDADRERVGLPVDTAPDVDPDEALLKAEGVTAILEDRVAFWQDEKRQANDAALAYLARAEKAEARHKALRADVEGWTTDRRDWMVARHRRAILDRDDERGRDA